MELLDLKYYSDIFKKNPCFNMVLDTTHAVAAGNLKQLIKRFEKKIVYSHFSANYFDHLHMPLHSVDKKYLKISERDEQEQLMENPLLAYIAYGRFAKITETFKFPFPKNFKR